MNNFLKIFIYIVFFKIGISFSQDIHFSQFYAAPLLLNPSNTGDFSGDWRLANIHRNQWNAVGDPFLTTSVGIDKTFKYKNQKFSGGLLFFNDNSGKAKLQANKIFLSFGYHKELGKHTFHFGLQGGWAGKSFNFSEISFPDQYNHQTGQFDASSATDEPLKNNKLSYFDINGGIHWSGNYGKIKPKLGVSLYHINNPQETFFDTTNNANKLPMRELLHGGLFYHITENLYIYPMFQYLLHNKAGGLSIGSTFGLKTPESKWNIEYAYIGSFWRDGFNRNYDAVYFTAGLNFTKFDIGLGYDVNVSNMHNATNYKGAFEISFIYTYTKTIVKHITFPCDRY